MITLMLSLFEAETYEMCGYRLFATPGTVRPDIAPPGGPRAAQHSVSSVVCRTPPPY